jgi:ubiquitin carboxyl-terminal hydrolase 7
MSAPELRPVRATETFPATLLNKTWRIRWVIHQFPTLGREIQSKYFTLLDSRVQLILFWLSDDSETYLQLSFFGVTGASKQTVTIDVGDLRSDRRPPFTKFFTLTEDTRRFIFSLPISYATIRHTRLELNESLVVLVELPAAEAPRVTFAGLPPAAKTRRGSVGHFELPSRAPATDSTPKTNPSKDLTGFVGLLNQGATCYMNSCLQSLYHLPAFRRLVFNLPTTGTEDVEKSIPLNLQRLFCRMQMSRCAASTCDFTKSLGWGSADTFDQHDAQEFGRVLLDNLEGKLRGTELANRISDLFRGTIAHSVRCMHVSHESLRQEFFYELSMQVVGCDSLEQSFAKYIEKENLTGPNQYDTGEHGKQDAEMGVEFIQLPTILHIHLTRFTYDLQTWRPIKINTKFEFPVELDLTRFVRSAEKSCVYDLFGVLVHSGSGALGGHYFAFLRTSPDLQFFKFNDSLVTREPLEKAVDDNFGGKPYSAYMLVYVRHDDVNDIFEPIADEAIPGHLRDWVTSVEAEEERKRIEQMEQSKVSTVTVGLEEDITTNIKLGLSGFKPACERSLSLEKTTTLLQLYEKLAHDLGKEVSEIRIWETNYQRSPNRLVVDSAEVNIAGSGITSIFVQPKDPGEPLRILPTVCVIWVKFFYQKLEKIEYVGSFFLERDAPLANCVPLIATKLGLPPGTELWLFQESLNGPNRQLLLSETAKELKIETGTVLIGQFPAGQDPNQAVGDRVIGPHEGVEYRDVFPDEVATTVDDYLSASMNMSFVEIFNTNHVTDAPLAVLHVSASLSFERLKRLISVLLGLKYSPDRDAMLLQKVSDPATNQMSPMDTNIYPTLRTYMTLPRNMDRHRWFFQIVEGIGEEEMARSTRYTVQFSRDGFNVEVETKVFAPKKAPVLEIFKKTGIEVDFRKLRYSRVYNHMIDQVIDEESELANFTYVLRVDLVEGEPVCEYLLPVSFGFMQQGALITKAKGNPFFWPVALGEEFGVTKIRILQAVGWSKMEGTVFRFRVDKLGLDSEIADEVVLSEVGSNKSLLYIIAKEDTRPVAASYLTGRTNQPVRIYN